MNCSKWFSPTLGFHLISCVHVCDDMFCFTAPVYCSSQKLKNSSEVNSPPRSGLRHLIMRSNSFSTKALNALNFSKALSLCFRSPIQHILEKSSINNMKYSSPRGDLFLDGPHTSIWTSSSGLLADPSFSGKLVLVCLRN